MSRDVNVKVKQILWNPVMANTVAICLDDGTLGMYVLNETSFEYFALDKSNAVKLGFFFIYFHHRHTIVCTDEFSIQIDAHRGVRKESRLSSHFQMENWPNTSRI